jgi:hypothetical protein
MQSTKRERAPLSRCGGYCKYFTFYPFGPLAHCSMLLSYFIVRHHVVTITDLVLILVKGSIQRLVSSFVT